MGVLYFELTLFFCFLAANMSHSSGEGNSEFVGAEKTIVNGNSGTQKDRDKGSISPNNTSAPPLNCCLKDTAGHSDLDDRIRSALDELESPSRSHGGNGYLLANRIRTDPLSNMGDGKVSEESDSDSEGDEVCPSAMGYMPLPQDPEDDAGYDYLSSAEANTVEDIKECIHSRPQERQEDLIPRAASVETAGLEGTKGTQERQEAAVPATMETADLEEGKDV